MVESSEGGGSKTGILSELHLLRQWVEIKVKPIEKNISDLWKANEKAREHKCVKEDTLRTMMKSMEAIPTMRENISSWTFFRNIFLGVFGTLLVISVAAVVAFFNVQADTENSKREIAEQAEQIDSVKSKIEHIKNNTREEEKTLIDMRESLKKIEEAVLEKKTRKKKKT